MLIQLRRQIFTSPAGYSSPYVAQVIYYDTDTRRPYPTQLDSLLNDPAELAKDALVDTYQSRPGVAHEVRYNGNGSVYTRPVATPVASQVQVKVGLAPFYTSNAGVNDACVDLTGKQGLPPYQIILTGTLGSPSAGYHLTATSPSELFPVRFYNMPEGEYVALVRDATGALSTESLTVTRGQGYARGQGLREEQGKNTIGYQWSYNDHNIKRYDYGKKDDGLWQLPYGVLVDAYFENGLVQWRRVYSDGRGGVYYTDQLLAAVGTLALDNLIFFHPDTVAEKNGGFVLEMRADHLPLTYQLSTGGTVLATNQTGYFDGLASGAYDILVTDQLGTALTVSYTLLDRYGLRWQHTYSDVANVLCRLEMWAAGYTGALENIYGQADPVVLKTDGLSGSIGGQGDMGPVVGSSAELNLKVTTETFEEIISSDRYCRVDFYYNNILYFRGFIEVSTYDAPLLPGLQNIQLTATDGLASLKGTNMLGHEGQRLIGHRPWLNTLLHCFARTEVSLPLRIFTNRRDSAMATTEAPELAATSNRTGYWDEEKNEPLTQRQTIEAIAEALGGTLVQRAGAWEVRNILEAAFPTDGRAYLPAGTPLPAVTAPAPTATVLPPTQGPLFWLERSQAMQLRAGWKSLTGKTDVGYLKNAYVAGGVFSDKNAWLSDSSQLQPTSGWHPAPGTTFPLILTRTGEKGTDYATQWPRSAGYSTWTAGAYLQGPALPLAQGNEAVQAALQITGRLAAAEFFLDTSGNPVVAATNARKAILSYELVVDGQPGGVQFVELDLDSQNSGANTTVSTPLPQLPSSTVAAELRLYDWYAADTGLVNYADGVQNRSYDQGEVVRLPLTPGAGYPYRLFAARKNLTNLEALTIAFVVRPGGPQPALPASYAPYWYEITATNGGLGTFFLSTVGVQLTPQGATWEGEDNFRADGAGGSIRPTEVLDVFHADVPIAAGLYGGNLYAFGKAVALADGTMSTSWRRSIDKDASPLFESDVYDGLALRDGPSRLLTGTLSHRGTSPVLMLDTLDLPFEVAGVAAHRYCVCTTSWSTKHATTEVSLVQNGVGASAPDPYGLTGNVLVCDMLYQYLPNLFVPYAMGTDDGSLLSWE